MNDVAIGVDIGGTKSLALLVSRDGKILGEDRRQTPHAPDASDEMTLAIGEQIISLCAKQSLDPKSIKVGLGLPGLIRRDGTLAYAPNWQSAHGINLAESLKKQLGTPHVYSDNDANCAALCEHEWGAVKGIDDFVMVTLGTGIGGALFVDGALQRGKNGFAGEIGHMVVNANGAECLCGGKGCWERYCSGGALQRMTSEAVKEGKLPKLSALLGKENVRGEDVSKAAGEGSEEAVAIMREIGWWMALGLSNLEVLLDSGTYVIGGGLSTVFELVLPAAREYLDELVEAREARPPFKILPTMFGPNSGALGAALLAFEGAK